MIKTSAMIFKILQTDEKLGLILFQWMRTQYENKGELRTMNGSIAEVLLLTLSKHATLNS